MCYQAFVHYRCGHSEIVEAGCALAQGIPFFVKHACSNYQYDTNYPDQSCGSGRFYCRHIDHDGHYLDSVYATLQHSQGELLQIDEKLAVVRQKAVQFLIAAEERGLPEVVYKRHEAHGRLKAAYTDLRQQKERIETDRTRVDAIMQEASAHFRRRGQAEPDHRHAGFEPTLVVTNPLAIRFPMELTPQTPPNGSSRGNPLAPRAVALTQQAINVSEGNHVTNQARFTQATPGGRNIYVTPQRQHSGNSGGAGILAISARTPQRASATHSDTARQLLSQDSEVTNLRRRKAGPWEKSSPKPVDDGSNVRRSTRVRTQRVSYAESTGSEFSRDNSPEKPGSSPVKSESSESSEPSLKRQQQRKSCREATSRGRDIGRRNNNESLASKIGDWKRRTVDTTAAPHARFGKQGSFSSVTPPRHSGHSEAASAATQQARQLYGAWAHGTVRRLFPDITDVHAVTHPNLFKLYAQQSSPSVTGVQQPTPWQTTFAGAPYSTQQQGTAMQSSQPAAAYGQIASSLGPKASSGLGQQVEFANNHAGAQAHRDFSSNASYDLPQTQQTTECNTYTPSPFLQPQNGVSIGTSACGDGNIRDIPRGIQTPADSKDTNVPHGATSNDVSGVDMFTSFDYDRMQRSFNAAKHLFPAKASDLPASDTEPMKRAMPASSPTPMTKRVRLSLPDDQDTAEVVNHDLCDLAVETATSSPAKMPSPQNLTTSSAPFETNFSLAPVLAPTAIMYPQSQEQEAEVGNTGEDDTKLPGTGAPPAEGRGAEHAGSDIGPGFPGPEIDWQMLLDYK